jgi:hypothetical protein
MPDDSEDCINSSLGSKVCHETTEKRTENRALSGSFLTRRRYNRKDCTHRSRFSEILKSNLYKVIFQTFLLVTLSTQVSYQFYLTQHQAVQAEHDIHKNISVPKETEHFS